MSDPNSKISEYFDTYYLFNCNLTSSFIASKDGYAYCCQVITLVSLVFQILTLYCILKETPKKMAQVKASLLNLNFWYTFAGVYFSFFALPFFFYPYVTGFNIGLLEILGVPAILQWYIGNTINIAVYASIMLLFENRSSSIINNKFRMTKTRTRVISITVYVIGSMVLVAPYYVHHPDQVEGKLQVLKALPCPPKEFFTEPSFVFVNDPFWLNYAGFAVGIITFIPILVVLFFSACCVYYLILTKSSQVSTETRRFQIQAFYGIVLQIVIPFLFILVPLLVMMRTSYDGSFDQAKNNMTFLCVVLHEGVASAAILLVHRPYRKFLVQIISCKRKVILKVLSVSADGSSRI